jgi:hypothetical protein
LVFVDLPDAEVADALGVNRDFDMTDTAGFFLAAGFAVTERFDFAGGFADVLTRRSLARAAALIFDLVAFAMDRRVPSRHSAN